MEKQHILDEIKRTAAANGGKPLGARRFFQETGIKVSDWDGRHWINWGDALIEAGYPRNKMNAAYEKDHLIEKYIALMREIGHVPVRGELKIKRRKDSSFPSFNVFANQLGLKNQLLDSIVDYCQNKSGYNDIVKMCSETHRSQVSIPSTEKSDTDNFGFVYLLKSGRYYKIGKSNSAGRREYELAIQLPDKVLTVHVISTDDPSGIEVYWHNRFASKRKGGEWFDLNSSDVKAFKRRKFM